MKIKKMVVAVGTATRNIGVDIVNLLVALATLLGEFFAMMWGVLRIEGRIEWEDARQTQLNNGYAVQITPTFQKVGLVIWMFVAGLVCRLVAMLFWSLAFGWTSMFADGRPADLASGIFSDIAISQKGWIIQNTVMGSFLGNHPNNVLQAMVVLASFVAIVGLTILVLIVVGRLVQFFTKVNIPKEELAKSSSRYSSKVTEFRKRTGTR